MNLVATPWENTVGKTAKQRVIAVALLFFAVIGISGLMALGSAKAQDVSDMVAMAQGTENVVSTENPGEPGVTNVNIPETANKTNETGVVDTGSGNDTDKINGDVNIMSPASMANKIESAQGFDYANNYLAMVRWNSFPLPSPGLNPLSGGDILNSIMASFAQMMFTFMGSLSAAIVGFFTVCFSNFFGTIFLRLGDMLFGAVIGGLFSGGGDIAKASALISAMVTVALVTSAMAAFDAQNAGKSIQARVMGVIMSVAKVIVFFIVIGGIGIQSLKNYGGSLTPEQAAQQGGDAAVEEINNSDGISPTDGSTAGVEFNADGGLVDGTTTEVKSKILTDASSWEPLSMGWIVSVLLDIANMMINAVLGLFNSMVLFPISTLASSLDRVATDNVIDGSTAPMAACDRYIDAMHFAYQNSSASRDSIIFSQLMVSMDTIYSRTVLGAYSIGYGESLSGNNAWCHMLENANGSSSGDRLMLGRTAGLWWEVAGDGNLLGSSSIRFTTGQHKLGGISANTEPVGVSIIARGSDGVLVKSSGEWQNTATGETPVRANVFFGKGSMPGLEGDNPTKAADTALYYFAACEWNPRSGNTYLNKEWNGAKVKAMPSADPDYEDKNNYLSVEQAEEMYEGGDEGKFVGHANNATAHNGGGGLLEHSKNSFMAVVNTGEEGDANASQYLQNVDCFNIANLPSGHFKEGNNFGWGANNRMSDRWYYAPQNANLFAQTVDRATSTSPGAIRGVVSMFLGDEGEKAERDSQAENAFSGAEDPQTNRNYTQEFWLAANGRGGSGDVLGSVFFSMAAFICVVIFMLPAALIGLVIHLVFGLLLAIAPAVVLLNVLLRTIKGGR